MSAAQSRSGGRRETDDVFSSPVAPLLLSHLSCEVSLCVFCTRTDSRMSFLDLLFFISSCKERQNHRLSSFSEKLLLRSGQGGVAVFSCLCSPIGPSVSAAPLFICGTKKDTRQSDAATPRDTTAGEWMPVPVFLSVFRECLIDSGER